MDKKLYLSKTNRIIGGVCGGLADYVKIDATIIRIVVVAISLLYPFMIIVYIAGILLIPARKNEDSLSLQVHENEGNETVVSEEGNTAEPSRGVFDNEKSRLFIGGTLLFIGAVLLTKYLIPGVHYRYFWPLALIAAGAFIIYKGWRR